MRTLYGLFPAPIRLPSHKQPGDEANRILNQIAMESSATTPNSRVNVASGYGVVAMVTVVAC